MSKRHQAFHDLSRDHRRFIHEVRLIFDVLDGDDASLSIASVVESVLQFWKDHGEPHLREEETVLFPFYLSRAPLTARKSIQSLIIDHNWLREKIDELADLPRFENCSALLRSIGEYMTNHLREEEKVIFPQMQEHLGETALQELHEKLSAFRRQYRTADASTTGSDDLSDMEEFV